jgi:DASH complex subunit DAD1
MSSSKNSNLDRSQEFEELLSSTNVLNRKLEEVLGMTKEYETIAALWLSFYQLMHNYGQDDEATEEQQPGMPGTGGHLVSTKLSNNTKND